MRHIPRYKTVSNIANPKWLSVKNWGMEVKHTIAGQETGSFGFVPVMRYEVYALQE